MLDDAGNLLLAVGDLLAALASIGGRKLSLLSSDDGGRKSDFQGPKTVSGAVSFHFNFAGRTSAPSS
jgi:hypothetical protein